MQASPEAEHDVLDHYVPGSSAWLPDQAHGWVSMKLVSRGKDATLVFQRDDNGAEVRVTPSPDRLNLPPLANPPMLDGVDDLTTLSYLHEPGVLQNVRARYGRKVVYTYSGIVLVAVNPYQRLNIYGHDTVKAYAGMPLGQLEPHLFAVAENAFRCMVREGRHQSIIVTGESGAGKTVSTKYVMRYFASVESKDASMTEVEEQVMASNPIMEAFGNARTIRNNNSSRFGKYIQIVFNDRNKIEAASMRTFLLERSRVVSQADDERSYHIFYQLLAGCPAAERAELHLGHASQDYHIVNQGNCPTVPDMNDAVEFGETVAAFSKLGMSVSEQWKVFRIIAALLHLGNVSIARLSKREDEAAISSSDEALKYAAELLSVDGELLARWICRRQITTRSEVIVTVRTVAEAITARDAIIKYIYAHLFDWLVQRLNRALMPTKLDGRHIGLLDIYGFEIFKVNSFEQFCINYTNEKLQQEFVQHVFKLEQALYAREQIVWSYIDYADNHACIELIEGRMGIFSLLDEECRVPKGTDISFATKLSDKLGGHPNFGKLRFAGAGFVVRHYAQPVEYDCTGFLEKNRDNVTEEQLALLLATRESLLVAILTGPKQATPARSNDQSPAEGGKTIAHKRTLSSIFRSSVVALMETIRATTSHYIRCIKPNSTKAPFVFEPRLVLGQLRACGVLETIKISAAGYPSRSDFTEFAERYRVLVNSSYWSTDDRELSTSILKQSINDPHLSQIGVTKVFMRAGQLARLEKLRHDRIAAAAVLLQKNLRRHVQRKRYIKLRSASILFQRWTRGALARKRYQNMRLKHAMEVANKYILGNVYRKRFRSQVAAVRCIQTALRAKSALALCHKMKLRRSVVRIQAFVRMVLARIAYRRAMRAIIRCQSYLRRRIAFRELKALRLDARDVVKYRESSFLLERKVVELSQALVVKTEEAKKAARDQAVAEERLHVAQDSAKREHESALDYARQLAQAQAALDVSRDQVEALERQAALRAREHEEEQLAARKSAAEAAAVAAREHAEALEERAAEISSRDVRLAEAEALIASLRAQLADSQREAEERRGEILAAKQADADIAAQRIQEVGDQLQVLQKTVTIAVRCITRLPEVVDPLLEPYLEGRDDLLPFEAPPVAPPAEEPHEEPASSVEPQVEAAVAEAAPPVPVDEHPAVPLTEPNAAPEVSLSTPSHDESASDGWVLIDSASKGALRVNVDGDYEREIVHKVILHVVLPILHNSDGTVPERDIVFPAQIVGATIVQLMVHQKHDVISRFMSAVFKAIHQSAQRADDLRLVVFWLANSIHLRSFVDSLPRATDDHSRSGADSSEPGLTPRLSAKLTNDLLLLTEEAFASLMKLIKDRLQKLINPAIIDYDPQARDIFGRVKSPPQAVAALYSFMSDVVGTLRSFYLDASTTQQTLSAMLYYVGGYLLNQLLLRRELCRPRRTQSILVNIAALTKWCTDHNCEVAALHLNPVTQACSVMQLRLSGMEDLAEVTDTCFLLNNAQVYKLLSNFRTDDRDKGANPQLLDAISRTSVSDSASVLCDIIAGHARYDPPPTVQLRKVNPYIPAWLRLDCVHVEE